MFKNKTKISTDFCTFLLNFIIDYRHCNCFFVIKEKWCDSLIIKFSFCVCVGEGDTGDHWIVVCDGEYWEREETIMMKHVDTDM